MRAFVGVTDNDWFNFLRGGADVDEVNFWQPGGNRRFQALSPGEPFFFKLHSPQNYIVGGGFFLHSTLLPCSLAWESFGQKNGAATFHQMRQRIEKYRRIAPTPQEDYQVGCIVLTDPFFLPREEWLPVPADWSPNIVQGKGYDLQSPAGKALWNLVSLRLAGWAPGRSAQRLGEPAGPVYGDPVLMRQRLHQGAFRVLVTDVYARRCAITGEKSLPVLEAAHIKPVSREGTHSIRNGLLLRSDIHRLFDRGYVTVTPDFRFHVSGRLRQDYDNGRVYYELQGRRIWVPKEMERQPDCAALEWHADTLFLK